MMHVRLARLLVAIAVACPALAAARPVTCLETSGDAAARCLHLYVDAVDRCRSRHDAACESALRAANGPLATFAAATEAPVRGACSDTDADTLGFVGGQADVVLRTRQACQDYAEDILGLVWASGRRARCARAAAKDLRILRDATVALYGPRCFVRAYAGGRCNHAERDRRRDLLLITASNRLRDPCAGDASIRTTTIPAVFDRARHFAQQVYPPNDLGPTADLGPFPVGVRTLALSDPARLNVAGTGPRPVVTEVYYPSTPAAVAGVPRDIARVLGVDIVPTQSYRDVARAPGKFPVVLFSHGNGGIRFQSLWLMLHLASHGYIVASPDHHGNTFVDLAAGIVEPLAAGVVNRPRDMSFVLDQLLDLSATPGTFLTGGVDGAHVGMSGHSFGGLTSFLMAGHDASFMGDDPRIDAILPLAPAAGFSPEFLASIHVPALIMGGTLDTTTPFAANQQAPFDGLPTGASIVALAELAGAGHFTFSDICEVPRNLVGFIGGFDEACQPRHLPWRHAHDIVSYFALNFFDGVLRDDPTARARLTPGFVSGIDDLTYQTK